MAGNKSPRAPSSYDELVDRCMSLEARYVKLKEEVKELVDDKRREENYRHSGRGGDVAPVIESEPFKCQIPGFFTQGTPYKSILKYIGHAIHVCSASTGEIIYWNRSAETLYGWKECEVLGQSVAELLVAEEHYVPLREITEQVCSGQTWSGQFPFKKKSDKMVMALVTKSPLYEDGKLAGIITVSSDATVFNSTYSENKRLHQDHTRVPKINLKKIQWHPRPPVIPIPQIASSVSNMASKLLSWTNDDGISDAQGDSGNIEQSTTNAKDINPHTPDTLAAKMLRKMHIGRTGSTFEEDNVHGQQNDAGDNVVGNRATEKYSKASPSCKCFTDVNNQGGSKRNSTFTARGANSRTCDCKSRTNSVVSCPVQSSVDYEESCELAKPGNFLPRVGHLENANELDPLVLNFDAVEIEEEALKQPDSKQYQSVGGSSRSLSSRGENESNPTMDCEIQWENLHLREEVGQGSYAAVYRGIWNGSDVAVKVYFGNEYKEETLQDYRKEIGIMKKLRHPNVLLFMGAVYTAERLAIVTEFLPRGSLFKVLHKNNQALDMKRRLKMALDVARGMNYLHHRNPPIVHRDLKSSNLLVDKNWNVKVGDFGLSRWKNATFLTAKSGRGTPQWMAPEVLRNEPSNEKSDVFGYGVILWELMTVCVPWVNLNPLQVVGVVGFMGRRLDLPGGLDPRISSIIQDCWESNPSERPSFEEIILRMTSIIQQVGAAAARLPAASQTEDR